MTNMSYCRFQNTLSDLQDCAHALYAGEAEDEYLSEEERRAKRKLIELCQEIADDYGEPDEDDPE